MIIGNKNSSIYGSGTILPSTQQSITVGDVVPVTITTTNSVKTSANGNTIYTFTNTSATGTFTVSGNVDAHILIVGGGGAGGSDGGGGGGAGGYVYKRITGLNKTLPKAGKNYTK